MRVGFLERTCLGRQMSQIDEGARTDARNRGLWLRTGCEQLLARFIRPLQQSESTSAR